MKTNDTEQVLMRIFVGETQKHDGKPLYRAILELLKAEKAAGATVFRGICGFGSKGHMHSAHLLTLSEDLPMVIEVVDTEEKIEDMLPVLDDIIGKGLVTLEKVRAIRFEQK
jgi:PII-like signaling protein